MTFRTRLLLIFTVAVAAAVGVVELVVSSRARQAFEDMEAKRAEALVTQFNREFARRGLPQAFKLCGPAPGAGFHPRSRPVGPGGGPWHHRPPPVPTGRDRAWNR